MNYKQAIDYLENFIDYEKLAQAPRKNPFRLDRIRKLLNLLGSPQNKFKSVHIAGTNGKGSTAAMLASILSEAGFKTGLYTSPHLITFRERIKINGKMLSEAETAMLAVKIKAALSEMTEEDGRPSFFEVYTAMCFLHFAENRVHWAVIETGLGGRLDATNVIIPEISILTSIGLDHQRELGNNIEEIAREKCGIIKPSVPVIASSQENEAMKIIKKTAGEKNSNLTVVRLAGGKEETTPANGFCIVKPLNENSPQNDFSLLIGGKKPVSLRAPLPGRNQAVNAGVSAAAALFLGADEESIRKGLEKTSIPGRMQFITGSPPILLDGGHNPQAAGNLAEILRTVYNSYEIIIVFGVSKDKDFRGIAEKIFPPAKTIILTKSLNPRAEAPEILAEALRPQKESFRAAAGIKEALELARNSAGPKSLICVTGSFFLVGEALELIKAQPRLFQTQAA